MADENEKKVDGREPDLKNNSGIVQDTQTGENLPGGEPTSEAIKAEEKSAVSGDITEIGTASVKAGAVEMSGNMNPPSENDSGNESGQMNTVPSDVPAKKKRKSSSSKNGGTKRGTGKSSRKKTAKSDLERSAADGPNQLEITQSRVEAIEESPFNDAEKPKKRSTKKSVSSRKKSTNAPEQGETVLPQAAEEAVINADLTMEPVSESATDSEQSAVSEKPRKKSTRKSPAKKKTGKSRQDQEKINPAEETQLSSEIAALSELIPDISDNSPDADTHGVYAAINELAAEKDFSNGAVGDDDGKNEVAAAETEDIAVGPDIYVTSSENNEKTSNENPGGKENTEIGTQTDKTASFEVQDSAASIDGRQKRDNFAFTEPIITASDSGKNSTKDISEFGLSAKVPKNSREKSEKESNAESDNESPKEEFHNPRADSFIKTTAKSKTRTVKFFDFENDIGENEPSVSPPQHKDSKRESEEVKSKENTGETVPPQNTASGSNENASAKSRQKQPKKAVEKKIYKEHSGLTQPHVKEQGEKKIYGKLGTRKPKEKPVRGKSSPVTKPEKKAEKASLDYDKELKEVRLQDRERQAAITEKSPEKQVKKSGKEKKVTRRLVTGGVIFCLCFLGVLSIISGVVFLGMKVFDDSDEKREYRNLISTLVMYDPLPFESPAERNQQILLQSSVWATIMNEDLNQYEADEYGFTLLPASEVDRYFTRLFGPGVSLTHASFDDQGAEFVYDEERGVYVVPPTNFPSGFTPLVEDIDRSFNERILTVGYISPRTSMESAGNTTISKYMEYIFEKQNGEFYLVAVRESDKQVPAPSRSPSSPRQQ